MSKMDKIKEILPKHIQKLMGKRLAQLSTEEYITITIPVEVEVSCVWDEGDTPSLNFLESDGEGPEEMLRNADDKELKDLDAESIIELRDRCQKEITEWLDELERLAKAYSIDKDLLNDFFIYGHDKE